jgi:phospholipid/cholesterol/gamma-HCH transport system substrate-binding protein
MGRPRVLLAIGLVVVLLASVFVVVRSYGQVTRTRVVGYFDNSSGLFPGDDVRILGVPVGRVEKIEPQPQWVKVSFWFDNEYKVPADAKAAILSPQLVTGRAIQLTPVYTGGPAMPDGAVIPKDRTAVPVEWDQVRDQLQKVADLLQPTKPGGVSTLGALIDTAADNLRGQGANIRDTVIKLSQAISALGDHSQDIFGTFKNLSTLVTALHDSSDLLEQLNVNLAAVTGLLADDPNKVGQAFEDLNSVVGDVRSFVADNRETIGTTSDKLASFTTALVQSLDDLKQTLHIAPDTLDNFNNIYEPANGSLTGALAVSNFSNPIGFLCGAVQAASRLRGDQAAKLCVQYLAPIVKNREWNFPPLGEDLFVGAQARPNEVTYSEDWMRPDYVPAGPPSAAPGPGAPLPAEAQPPAGPLPAEAPAPANPSTPLAAQAPPPANPSTPLAAPAPTVSTDPAAGLPGLMVPSGGGS